MTLIAALHSIPLSTSSSCSARRAIVRSSRVCTPSKSIHPPCFVIGLQCFRGRARSQGSRVVNLAEGWVHPGHDLVTELHRSRPKSTVSKARWSNHVQRNHTRNLRRELDLAELRAKFPIGRVVAPVTNAALTGATCDRKGGQRFVH